MTEPTFIIDDTFFIKGRGLLLLSLLDWDAAPPVFVRVGDEIELALEDGGCVRTTVTSVVMVHGGRPGQPPHCLGVSLGPDDQQVLRGAKAHVVN